MDNKLSLAFLESEECKKAIETGLLAQRISYFMHFPKTGLFSRHKYLCVFCVNETVMEKAQEIVNQIVEEDGFEVRFLNRKNPTSYL